MPGAPAGGRRRRTLPQLLRLDARAASNRAEAQSRRRGADMRSPRLRQQRMAVGGRARRRLPPMLRPAMRGTPGQSRGRPTRASPPVRIRHRGHRIHVRTRYRSQRTYAAPRCDPDTEAPAPRQRRGGTPATARHGEARNTHDVTADSPGHQHPRRARQPRRPPGRRRAGKAARRRQDGDAPHMHMVRRGTRRMRRVHHR